MGWDLEAARSAAQPITLERGPRSHLVTLIGWLLIPEQGKRLIHVRRSEGLMVGSEAAAEPP